MYQIFDLKRARNSGGKVIGYHWPKEQPSHVVCIIHGIGEHAGRYDKVATAMQEAGFAAVSMDLPGHGKSFGRRGHCAPRPEVLKDADSLIQYAQQLYPQAKIILYGHSMGGNIAMDYRKRGGANKAVDAFVISAPWVQLVRTISGLLYAGVGAMAKIMPAFGIKSGVSSKDLGSERTSKEYEKDPLVHGKISALCAWEGFQIGEALEEGNLEDNGGAEGKPMLLMHGTDDKICSIKGSQKVAAIEACEFIQWPGLYHEIHNGGPGHTGEEVIRKVIDWIGAI